MPDEVPDLVHLKAKMELVLKPTVGGDMSIIVSYGNVFGWNRQQAETMVDRGWVEYADIHQPPVTLPPVHD